jgi:hypothetical protein
LIVRVIASISSCFRSVESLSVFLAIDKVTIVRSLWLDQKT